MMRLIVADCDRLTFDLTVGSPPVRLGRPAAASVRSVGAGGRWWWSLRYAVICLLLPSPRFCSAISFFLISPPRPVGVVEKAVVPYIAAEALSRCMQYMAAARATGDYRVAARLVERIPASFLARNVSSLTLPHAPPPWAGTHGADLADRGTSANAGAVGRITARAPAPVHWPSNSLALPPALRLESLLLSSTTTSAAIRCV